ncbi:Signal transduction response regulator, receiver region domain protein [Candidatus Magnetomorum sp. HK-1]|nr:Signal transduction response regulator, receiver region domain protein [Candidatus Magnetomorum sp. HK-1]
MKDMIDLIISIDKYEAKHFFKRMLSPAVFRIRFSQNNLQFDNLYTNRRPDAIIINYEVQSRYISQLAGTVRNIQNDDMTKLIIVHAAKNKIETLPNSYDVQLYLHKQLKAEKFQRRVLSCFHLTELIDKIVGSKRMKENRLKLLVAEDDEKIVKMYDKFLSGIAFDTRFVDNGTDALITYDQWKPDIILLDILLPKMPGLEVLKEIRVERKDVKPAIIMATSQGSQETVKTCLQHGIQGYIIKPLDIARLNRVIIDNYIMHCIALNSKAPESKPVEKGSAGKSKNKSGEKVSTETQKDKSTTPTKKINKIKVLIVDDDPKIIQLYNKCLSQKAYEIKTAMDIEEGFKAYQSWSPDMIILDILFPKMSGIELLKDIREKCKDQTTTIVMATTQKKDAIIKECMSHNIQGYLMKPFDIKSINQSLYKYYQKNKK